MKEQLKEEFVKAMIKALPQPSNGLIEVYAYAAAALCEDKIKLAIELATEYKSDPHGDWEFTHTEEEILELLNQNK